MKIRLLLFTLFCILSFRPFTGNAQTVNTQDSLALVDLYNSTNGPGWTNNTNWLTVAPISTWYGVLIDNNRVSGILLQENNLIGILPSTLNGITGLTRLQLTNNQLRDSIPGWLGNLTALQILEIDSNRFSGNIPASLGNLTMLTSLAVNGEGISGEIPASLGNLTALKKLVLGSSYLSGEIPISLGNLTALNVFSVYGGGISGQIPSSFGNLTSLTWFQLNNTQLTGQIPSSLGNCTALTNLDINNNMLSGPIPSSLGNLTNLTYLSLAGNQLTGSIPPSLGNLSKVFHFWLPQNQLSGQIPAELGNLSSVGTLNLNDNQLTDTIPASLGNLLTMFDLGLSNNNLSGPIPSSIGGLSNLSFFTAENNHLTFDGMESFSHLQLALFSPQAEIPLHRKDSLFAVSAGGTLANNTYQLYKNGVLAGTQVGDSVFLVTAPGKYYITVTNNMVPDLTLQSTFGGLIIADAAAAVLQNINGSGPVEIKDTTSVLQKLLLTVIPTAGSNALSGDVNFKVTIDPAVTSFNNQPYVQRHFDITPASNATTAQATVTLYFTQQDFDNFNATPAHGLDLPTAPTDAAGIANLRVYQYHGFSTTSSPGSYSGNAVEIDPADANIIWNTAGQYWEVSFDVTGFSGFFVSSQNSALLPVRLVAFTGSRKGNQASLHWTSASEINTHYFEVQRSTDGNAFAGIGTIRAAGNSASSNDYVFNDVAVAAQVYYYRLKMIDIDGRFSYSKIIKLLPADAVRPLTVYPNPASDLVVVSLPVITTSGAALQLADPAGRIVKTYILPGGVFQARLSLGGLAKGIYKIMYRNAGTTITSTVLIR